MSHVASVDIHIKDLASLKAACEALGLEFVEGQSTYKWYGRHVGDYPVPDGFEISDMGKCLHAIRVKGNSSAYEVGVVKRRDGKPGFTLIYDFYSGGYGLEAVIGKEANNLRQQYSRKVALRQARRQGFTIQETKLPNGSIQLTAIQR